MRELEDIFFSEPPTQTHKYTNSSKGQPAQPISILWVCFSVKSLSDSFMPVNGRVSWNKRSASPSLCCLLCSLLTAAVLATQKRTKPLTFQYLSDEQQMSTQRKHRSFIALVSDRLKSNGLRTITCDSRNDWIPIAGYYKPWLIQ